MLPRYIANVRDASIPILCIARCRLDDLDIARGDEKGILAELDPLVPGWSAYGLACAIIDVFRTGQNVLAGRETRITRRLCVARSMIRGRARHLVFISGADVGKAAATIDSMAATAAPILWPGLAWPSCYAGRWQPGISSTKGAGRANDAANAMWVCDRLLSTRGVKDSRCCRGRDGDQRIMEQ